MTGDADHAARVHQLWKGLVRLFPVWSLPLDWVFSLSSWHMIGADMIRGQLRDPRVRRAANLLKDAPESAIESLGLLARLNEERTTSVFRVIAVCYVTLPIALAALLTEAAPDVMSAYVEANLDTIGLLLFALVATPIIYFLGMWRAKQMVWAIDLHRAGGIAAPNKA